MGDRSRAQAHIKQLCCLGLGGEAVIPAVLRELHALIPSHGNQFMWATDDLQLANLYCEIPDIVDVGPLYLEKFYNRDDREIGGFSDTLRRLHGVDTRDEALTIDLRDYYNGDLYNLVLRPLRADDFLRLVVREGGKPIGAVVLYRDAKAPPFRPADARHLAALEPFIAHALTKQPNIEMTLVESGETGLIIANGAGRLVYLSPEGRRLLFLATHPQLNGTSAPEGLALPSPVARIWRSLTAIFAGDEDASAPVYQHTNSWGGFTFRAYRLDPADTASSSLIGIAVSRQEPLQLQLMQHIRNLPLSSRQAEICLLMASGLTYRQIAERLHISQHTAIGHSRWIYDSLNVSNRTELVNKLLEA
jgi:DNA-binding CsgD family transcriptional regulator